MPRSSTARRLARPVILMLLLALAACDVVRQAGARSWGMSATNQAGTEHTITVTDRTGRVADVEFAPADADPSGAVTVAPGEPNALDVTWTGGACDRTTTLDIASSGPGLAVTVAIEDNGMPCDAMGLPQVVRLTFAQPVAPAAVTVTQ